MHPACSLCRGACCEAIILPVKARDSDNQRWLEYHGEMTDFGIYLECKCSKLKNGKCSIYQSRPNVCLDFPVGSPGCLAAIARRRPYKEQQIRRIIEDTDSNAGS